MKKISMKARKEVIQLHKKNYRKASKKEKGQIINTVCEATGLSRDRCARLLTGTKYIKSKKTKENRGRKVQYDKQIALALENLWHLLDFACGKRLKEAIPLMIDALERHNEIIFEKDIKNKLLKMSPATIDRLLKYTKKGLAFRGKSTTKPGTLLKKDIPIRLGNQWNDAVPGFVEIDLVAHCGDTTAGDYVNTLDVTDISTGWTETRAVLNKSQRHVFDGLMAIKQILPFPFQGIDSDNGGEFINEQLLRYCKLNNICFTRSRPHKSNDNCHVEQKNWAIVRKNIGYDRYEGKKAVDTINAYYDQLRFYTNFFLPQTKLINRQRIDSKIIKKYDKPKTPYQRVMESKHINKDVKKQLTEQFLMLNPISIKKDMVKTLELLKTQAIPWDAYHKLQKRNLNHNLLFMKI